MYSNVGELRRYMKAKLCTDTATKALEQASTAVDVFLGNLGAEVPANPSDAIAWRQAVELETRQAAALIDPDQFADAAEEYAMALVGTPEGFDPCTDEQLADLGTALDDVLDGLDEQLADDGEAE